MKIISFIIISRSDISLTLVAVVAFDIVSVDRLGAVGCLVAGLSAVATGVAVLTGLGTVMIVSTWSPSMIVKVNRLPGAHEMSNLITVVALDFADFTFATFLGAVLADVSHLLTVVTLGDHIVTHVTCFVETLNVLFL